MDAIQRNLLEEVAGIHEIPEGAYNIRSNGSSIGRNTTANIDIITKEDKSGIDIIIKPGTKNESVHIPVILSQSGLKETVYNDFYIGEGADVTIVAGCGIHNCGVDTSEHSGIHTFFVEKNAKVKYIEKHYGEGDGNGKNVMNPTTIVNLDENAYLEMETVQIKGVDSTERATRATLKDGATIVIKEKIMTHGSQVAKTDFTVDLNGAGSSANVISRSVAKGNSHQLFLSNIVAVHGRAEDFGRYEKYREKFEVVVSRAVAKGESYQVYQSVINGNNKCYGHTECDAIIMDSASVSAVPQITANNIDASLIHEAAIGKIAGEQLIKLMTLGLTEAEAEEQIVNGFLK